MAINDLFERNKFIDKIHGTIEELRKSGGAIAINAPFGMGKTTFCNIYRDYLAEKGYCSSIVDISFYDHCQEPFIAIHGEFYRILPPDHELKLKGLGRELFKRIGPLASIISGVKSAANVIEKMLETSLPKEVEDYKKALEEVSKGKEIIIFIDELDRCTPDYMLLFLERLKHYFNVQGILFILMINENHILSSIEHVLGFKEKGHYMASQYLEKFLSYPIINLPHVKDYTNLSSIHYDFLFKESNPEQPHKWEVFIEILKLFSISLKLNYRQQKILQKKIYVSRIEAKKEIWLFIITYLIILSVKDVSSLHKLIEQDEDDSIYLALLDDIPESIESNPPNYHGKLLLLFLRSASGNLNAIRELQNNLMYSDYRRNLNIDIDEDSKFNKESDSKFQRQIQHLISKLARDHVIS